MRHWEAYVLVLLTVMAVLMMYYGIDIWKECRQTNSFWYCVWLLG